MYYCTYCQSPIGTLTLASDGDNLVGLWLKGQKYHGASILDVVSNNGDIPVFDKTKAWLDLYFSGNQPKISELPLAPIGSDFRQRVWSILRKIPYGQLITYGEIARELALSQNKKSMSSQAVGGAVGHNPISIIIPCHRVVGANGSLTGYSGGIAAKIALLKIEGVDLTQLTIPTAGTAI